MSITMQVATLLGFTFVVSFALILVVLADQWYRINSKGSAKFITANAASNLSMKIDSVVEEGVEILIPAGKGLYPLKVSTARRREWENLHSHVGKRILCNFVHAGRQKHTIQCSES